MIPSSLPLLFLHWYEVGPYIQLEDLQMPCKLYLQASSWLPNLLLCNLNKKIAASHNNLPNVVHFKIIAVFFTGKKLLYIYATGESITLIHWICHCMTVKEHKRQLYSLCVTVWHAWCRTKVTVRLPRFTRPCKVHQTHH